MKLDIDKSMILCQSKTRPLPWQEEREIYYLEPDTILTIEDFTLENDLIIVCNAPLENYLECVYCLSGEGNIQYQQESSSRKEEDLPSHRICWQSWVGKAFIKSRHPVKVVHIYFTQNGLTKYLGGNRDLADKFLRIFNYQSRGYGQREGDIPPMMETIVHQIMYCRLTGFVRQLFLHAKVEELLALELEYWMYSENIKNNVLSSEDRICLNNARKILFSEYQDPPSLSELARKVGINRHKLTTGFRQLFGTTVRGALRDFRMENAKQLLDKGNTSVTQVSLTVGYSNISHFCGLFQKQYGVLPGSYLRHVKATQNHFPSRQNDF